MKFADDNVADMEREMPVPMTSFEWYEASEDGPPTEWSDDIAALGDWLIARAKGSSSIISLPGAILTTDTTHYKNAKLALDIVVSLSEPCEGHILRSRVLDILEARLPGEDDHQKRCMDALNEGMHVVWMKERMGK